MKSMARRSTIIVFPVLALAFSVGCAAAVSEDRPATSSAAPDTRAAGSTTSQVSKSAAGDPTALSVLAGIRIAREVKSGYQRTKFRHWTDADGDGCNTREEVLIAETSSPAQVSWPGCKVVAGDWYSWYDNVATSDPAELQIDHFVPLKEAWDSGADRWTSARRQQFANDLSDERALTAVSSGRNQSKGEKDPPQWMPPHAAAQCTYLSDWVAVKARWKLSMDESEYRFIEKRLKGQCAGTTLAPWGSGSRPVADGGSVPGTTATTVAGPGPATDPTEDTVKGALPTVKPGAFCTPKGARGTYNGSDYVCSTTRTTGEPYKDGRARWRAA